MLLAAAQCSTWGGVRYSLFHHAGGVSWQPCLSCRKLGVDRELQSYRHERAREVKPLSLPEVVHDCSLNPESWMSLQASQSKDVAVLKSTRRMWLGSVKNLCPVSDCPVCTPSLLLCYFAVIYFRKLKPSGSVINNVVRILYYLFSTLSM